MSLEFPAFSNTGLVKSYHELLLHKDKSPSVERGKSNLTWI